MSDSSTPLMGMFVAPDGSITYDFDGTVHATGLTMEQLPSAGEEGNTIEWLRNGEDRSHITSYETGEILSFMEVVAKVGEAVARLYLRVRAGGTGEKESNGLIVQYKGGPEKLVFGESRPAAATGEGLQKESSSFLQLAVEPRQRKIAFGTVVVTFAGGTVSAATKVKHGLGVTPKYINLTQGGFELGMLFARWQNATETEFEAVGCSPLGGVTGTATFTWFAIG